jgi:hypothetical protein
VNLIVGFWVSASRRHRVCFDDGEGDGEEAQDTTRRERWRRTDARDEARGEGVSDKTAGVPTPVAGYPHEIYAPPSFRDCRLSAGGTLCQNPMSRV